MKDIFIDFEKYLQLIIICAVIGLSLVLITAFIPDFFTRFEIIECDDWKQQEVEYPSWYSTDWQREQCKQFGIFFDK